MLLGESCISGGISDKKFLTNISKEVEDIESKYKLFLSLNTKFIGQEIFFKYKWLFKESNWPQSVKPTGGFFPIDIEFFSSSFNKRSS